MRDPRRSPDLSGADGEPRSPRRFLRFVLVGGVNAIFGYGVYGLALYAGLALPVSLALANVAGILFNFVTSGRFVWDDRDLRKFPRFVAAYGLAWVVGTLLIALVSSLGPARLLDPFPELRELANRHRPTALDEFVAGVLLLPISALVTYGLLARFVYSPEARARVPSSGTK